MTPARNVTITALLLSCALAILLARCGTDRDIPAGESGMDGGPDSGAPDGGIEDRDGGTDGGEQPDGGNELDGGTDGGQQNDGGIGQNDGGTALSYERDIQPIIQARCATSGCHAPPSPAGGLDLSPDVSWVNLVNQPTNCRPSVPRVAPGDPPGSMLWRKSKPVGLPDRCGGVMPQGTLGLGVIAPEDFAKVEAWIQQGALDN